MQEIPTCILVITLASLMAFDTDGIGRTYVQLKNAGNSLSLNCKYFLLELSGGGREPRIVFYAFLNQPFIFKALHHFFLFVCFSLY